MTDREMLELAAKAAGIVLEWNDRQQPGYWSTWRGLPQWEEWNPLTDDGDALRLAVRLGITVSARWTTGQDYTPGTGVFETENDVDGPPDWWEAHGTDPYAATRRAITRAAAEIGGGCHDRSKVPARAGDRGGGSTLCRR